MFYNLKRMPDGWRMVKFDNLFNVEAVYYIRFSRGRFYCDCPAAKQPSCKHREMIPVFIDNKAVDSGKFLRYDTGEWYPPIHGVEDVEILLREHGRSRKVSRDERKHDTRAGRQRRKAFGKTSFDS